MLRRHIPNFTLKSGSTEILTTSVELIEQNDTSFIYRSSVLDCTNLENMHLIGRIEFAINSEKNLIWAELRRDTGAILYVIDKKYTPLDKIAQPDTWIIDFDQSDAVIDTNSFSSWVAFFDLNHMHGRENVRTIVPGLSEPINTTYTYEEYRWSCDLGISVKINDSFDFVSIVLESSKLESATSEIGSPAQHTDLAMKK